MSGDAVLMRDSKDPAGPMLTFSVDAWRDFIDAVKNDDLNST